MKKGSFYCKILYYAKKIKAIHLLGSKCKMCGENDIFKLCFHHRSDKEIEMNRFKYQAWSKIENEIKKCDLLCHNCHIEFHFGSEPIDNRFKVNKNLFLEYKDEFSCSICDYNKCQSSLHFHHKSDKLFTLAKVSVSYKNIFDIHDNILKELDKCTVVCANCHYRIHTHVDFYYDNKDKILSKVNNMPENRPKIDRDLTIKMYNDGNKQSDIARFFGCDRATVCKIIKEFNIPKIKLKDEIIKLSNENFSRMEISKKLNISYSIVKYHLGKTK
jgi:predicted transcriptional regulator